MSNRFIFDFRLENRSWEYISDQLGWTRRNLYNWRQSVRFADPYLSIYPSDDTVATALESAFQMRHYSPYSYVCNQLNIGRKWLSRWRQRTNFVDPRQRLNDEDLQVIVGQLAEGHPGTGIDVYMGNFFKNIN